MTLRSRARTLSGTRPARRISPCYLHPHDPVTGGVCASCLRERLSGLDAAASSSPELRRCRSVAPASASSATEPRRKSCDVVSARSSLSNLFDVADLNKIASPVVESKNVGPSKVTYTVIEPEKDHRDQVRVSSCKLGESNSDGTEDGGEFKTMKEYIDLEFQNNTNKKSKDFREFAGNLASVFTRKLRNWRQNNSNNKLKNHKNSVAGNDGNLKLNELHSEIVGRRRSCDAEPRFSVDAARISFDEPRASWDGYMIARTIPRLAPMFSVVENGILGSISSNNKFENHRLSVDGPMHSIVEDESSSGASGSGVSNSDSSCSMRRSSFDRSSSVRSFGKKVVGSPANVKLVITEKELKDWHLSSNRDEGLEKFGSVLKNNGTGGIENVGNLNAPVKKSVKWRKVCNVFGLKPKNNETFGGRVIDPFIDGQKEEKEARDGGWKLARSTSVVGSRNSCDVIESNFRRRSVDNAGGFACKGIEDFKLERSINDDDNDDGITPFYMTPLRSLKHSKSGKFKLQNTYPTAKNVLHLN